MKNTHQIYLISDSTGETLDRIFMALKAQFNNFNYELNQFSFTRTENQIYTILKEAKKKESPIILYTVVNSSLAKFLAQEANKMQIPCFGVLGDLILNFSKILNQKATHQPSGQHVLDEEYYKNYLIAKKAGVNFIASRCKLSSKEIIIEKKIKIIDDS